MPNYDFHILQFNEFECLCRDLLQKKMNSFIESFTEGKDGGIDLRFAHSKSHNSIVQVKRYKDYKELYSTLKKEVIKVQKLNPKRYFVMTSVGLTPANKTEIQALFGNYIQNTDQILGRDDINNLLGIYPEVERQYFKLWLSSTNVLEEIINKHIVNYSQFELVAIKDTIRKYVPNPSFNSAIKILNENRFVIISGIPGIGKTTLARMLAYHLLAKGGYEHFVNIMGDIEDGYKMFQQDKKQLFYYDDFLGSNIFSPKEMNFEHRLIAFLNAVKCSDDKLLILTTREYILTDAMMHYQSLRTENLEIGKCVINLQTYSDIIRARILYNHLADAQLPAEYLHDLLDKKNYLKLIGHRNYNPRIIEYFIDKNRWKNTSPTEFTKTFLGYFNNPESVWESAFDDLVKESQYFLFILATMGLSVALEDVKTAYGYFARESNIGLSLDPHIWNTIIPVLEETFIRTTKGRDKDATIMVSFINPSILDFLISRLRSNDKVVELLIKHSFYIEQIYTIFTDSPNKSNGRCSEIVLKDSQRHLIESSFKRHFKEPAICSRAFWTDKTERYYNVDFCHQMYKQFPNTCEERAFVDETIEKDWLLDTSCPFNKRVSLVTDYKSSRTGFGHIAVIQEMMKEDLSISEYSELVDKVGLQYNHILDDDSFCERIYNRAKQEISELDSSAIGHILTEELESIIQVLPAIEQGEDLVQQVERAVEQLELETEVEADAEEIVDESTGDKERIDEMFSSLIA